MGRTFESCRGRRSIENVAAIVQRLERLIVVQDVEGSNPSSRPTLFLRIPLKIELIAASRALRATDFVLVNGMGIPRRFPILDT